MNKVLTSKQAEVIELRYLEGVPTDRLVGERLGIGRSAVARRRLRALERLRNDDETRVKAGKPPKT